MAQGSGRPEERDPEVAALVRRLRELIGDSGLSLPAVAVRTGLDAAWWRWCLAGRTVPPRAVAVEVARLAGADPDEMTALWDRAVRVGSRPGRPSRGGPARPPERRDPAKHQAPAKHRDPAKHQAPAERRVPGPAGYDRQPPPAAAGTAGAPGAGTGTGRIARTDRAERAGLAEGADRADRTDPGGREGRAERAGRAGRADRAERADLGRQRRRADHGERAGRPGRGTDRVVWSGDPADLGYPAVAGTDDMGDAVAGAAGAAGAGDGGNAAGTVAGAGDVGRADRLGTGTGGAPAGWPGGGDAAVWEPFEPSAADPPPIPYAPPQPFRPGPSAGPSGTATGSDEVGVGAVEGLGRRASLFLAGLVGALLVIAVALLLLGPGEGDRQAAGRHAGARQRPAASGAADTGSTAASAPSASARRSTTGAAPASGAVTCTGKDCTGRDPSATGCADRGARSAANVTVGPAYVEVRYSALCHAVWARVARGSPGDAVRVTVPAGHGEPARTRRAEVSDGDAYTRMIGVRSAAGTRACVTLASGQHGCTAAATAPATRPHTDTGPHTDTRPHTDTDAGSPPR